MKMQIQVRLKICFMVIGYILWHSLSFPQMNPHARIVNISAYSVCSQIQVSLNKIIKEINNINLQNTNLIFDPTVYTDYGYHALSNLIAGDRIFFSKRRYDCYVLYNEALDYFQIRDFTVQIGINKIRKNSTQQLIFDFDTNGKLKNVSYDVFNIREIDFSVSDSVKSKKHIAQIIDFLRDFSNAYHKKDLEYITKVFHENALIIVGHVLQDAEFEKRTSYKIQPNVKLYRFTKTEYIERLKTNIFAKNESINIHFSRISIKEKIGFPGFYGVSLFQEWNSTTYYDKGWLFLLIDFRSRDNAAIIHVRTWHPEFYPSTPPITAENFEIITFTPDSSSTENK